MIFIDFSLSFSPVWTFFTEDVLNIIFLNSHVSANLNLKVLTNKVLIKQKQCSSACLFGLIASNRTIIPEICCCDSFWGGEQCVLFLVSVIV